MPTGQSVYGRRAGRVNRGAPTARWWDRSFAALWMSARSEQFGLEGMGRFLEVGMNVEVLLGVGGIEAGGLAGAVRNGSRSAPVRRNRFVAVSSVACSPVRCEQSWACVWLCTHAACPTDPWLVGRTQSPPRRA